MTQFKFIPRERFMESAPIQDILTENILIHTNYYIDLLFNHYLCNWGLRYYIYTHYLILTYLLNCGAIL